MRTIPTAIFAGCALLIPASLIVHPFGNVRAQRAQAPLLQGAQVSPGARAIFQRACRNCHSEETEWPWYSSLAPLSWMIERDVHEAREHMNLSRWQEYSADRRADLLGRMGAEVRNRRMPLPKYLSMHPEARLSDADITELLNWARGERKRLRSPSPSAASGSAASGSQ